MYREGRAADNRGGRLGLGTETFACRAGQGRAARPEVVPPAVVVHEGHPENQSVMRRGVLRRGKGVSRYA